MRLRGKEEKERKSVMRRRERVRFQEEEKDRKCGRGEKEKRKCGKRESVLQGEEDIKSMST